jgi:hypothetical protein
MHHAVKEAKMNCNRKYQKSALRTYNASTQTVTASTTPLALLGSQCTDTGCAISASGTNITINKSGLYYLSADVTFTPTAAGTEIIQMYKDGVVLPCAIAQATTVADGTITAHIETVLVIASCCAVQPVFTIQASGVAGTVNWIGTTAVKLA